jgi:hypothetical protein
MSERFDELAFVVGFILAKHIPMLRSRPRGFARQEDWEIRDAIAKEIADRVRRHWRLENHPMAPWPSTPPLGRSSEPK